MKNYLEISVPLASQSLTFFIGTGFSKYLTKGFAPNWLELVLELTRKIDDPSKQLVNKMFSFDSSGVVSDSKLPLFTCAQILELEYKKVGKEVRQAVCEVIQDKINPLTVDSSKAALLSYFFSAHQNVNVITTNYDKILSDYILPNSRIFVEGSPIPRINTGRSIFHIHGSVLVPESIVLTLSDYFRFQQQQNYFSRKFYTLLQETTVVILGYSLGDFNLNNIFNEVRASRTDSLRRSDIYFVTRDSVEDLYKTFYEYTYGIDVIDNCEFPQFFQNLSNSLSEAQRLLSELSNLRDVLDGKLSYSDDFLKLRHSLPNILLQASTLGISISNANFIELLKHLLERKRVFTDLTGAWDQYAHLAEWLVEVGSLIPVRGTALEETFVQLVDYSFRMMRKEQVIGYSWQAYRIWESGFKVMRLDNQNLIRERLGPSYSSFTDVISILGTGTS
jgi:hypothetical protein